MILVNYARFDSLANSRIPGFAQTLVERKSRSSLKETLQARRRRLVAHAIHSWAVGGVLKENVDEGYSVSDSFVYEAAEHSAFAR